MRKQWADGPYSLIESPRLACKVEGKPWNDAAKCATEMCLVHNVIIRGMNCIINQAPSVSSPTDIKDFMEFAHSLYVMIHEHHITEEVVAFPMVEDATGVPEIMEQNLVQHEEFMPKIHEFQTYVLQIKAGVRKYDAKKFVGLLEGFAPLLITHLTSEISTITGLEKYNIDWAPINKLLQDYSVANADKTRQVPFILHNMDIMWENKLHQDSWPPLPWFVQLMFRWLYVPAFKGAWRFSSCDVYGRPKELDFAPAKGLETTLRNVE